MRFLYFFPVTLAPHAGEEKHFPYCCHRDVHFLSSPFEDSCSAKLSAHRQESCLKGARLVLGGGGAHL